jgi:DNA (cytosine-5)-methyltransferase 1
VGLKHLDLFSGIGGFALAARRVGWETVGFCEIDLYCRKIIEKHFNSNCWISVPGHICGGKTLGLNGDKELLGLEPDWIVIENVYHTWRRWVPELRKALYDKGYASLPIRLSAADMGATHVRARAFIIAHADSERLRQLSWWWIWEGRKVAAELAKSWDFRPDKHRKNDGIPGRVDRIRGLGNAIVPQVAEVIFRAINELEK